MKTAIFIILLAAAVLVGCNGADMPSNIQAVKAKYEEQLMQRPGVVSVGIGKDPSGRLVIVVGLEKSGSADAAAIPETLDGYPVRVQTVGQIKAQ